MPIISCILLQGLPYACVSDGSKTLPTGQAAMLTESCQLWVKSHLPEDVNSASWKWTPPRDCFQFFLASHLRWSCRHWKLIRARTTVSHWRKYCVLDGWTTEDLQYLWKPTDPVQIVPDLHLPRFTLEKYISDYCNIKTNTGKYI